MVPMKAGNRPEGTRWREGGAGNMEPKEGWMDKTSSLTNISTRLRGMADLSRKLGGAPLTTLAHHFDLDWMREAYRLTRKSGSTGVDGQTAAGFAANLDENLLALLTALKSGQYRAPPVRRAYIPKSDGRPRPLGIPRYGLTLHPEKTRLLDFRHPWRRPKDADGPPRAKGPRSFDFLGFAHLWKKTRRGGFAACRQTASKRLSRALSAINQWCRVNRHRPIAEQHGELAKKLRGHFGTYDRVGNRSALWAFRYYSAEVWRKWLNRRSQRARPWWHRMERILERFALPRPTT